jgi:hypothetical protein
MRFGMSKFSGLKGLPCLRTELKTGARVSDGGIVGRVVDHFLLYIRAYWYDWWNSNAELSTKAKLRSNQPKLGPPSPKLVL